jgi:hypothetical protein
MSLDPGGDDPKEAFQQHHGRILIYAWRLTGCRSEPNAVTGIHPLSLLGLAK